MCKMKKGRGGAYSRDGPSVEVIVLQVVGEGLQGFANTGEGSDFCCGCGHT